MKVVQIGKDNSTFLQTEALKENRNKRSQTKLFFVEVVQNIKEALKNNFNHGKIMRSC